MNKFKRSLLLLKSSLSVIARNKELLIFPLVTFVCTIAIVLFFAAPAAFRPTGYSYTSSQHWQAISDSIFQHSSGSSRQVVFTPGAMTYLAGLYFFSMFIATFFNVAFYNEILSALTGQEVSLERGVKFAASKWKSILMWTLFAGLVGLLIKTLEEKLPLVGRITAKLIGIAWSIAAVFAIPVIVRGEQRANPLAILQESAGLLKRTWGEALIGYVGLTFVNFAIFVASLLWLFSAIAVSVALKNFWIIAAAGIVWFFGILAWSYLAGVASQVYKGALYLYASEGIVPAPYDREMLDMGWKFKKNA